MPRDAAESVCARVVHGAAALEVQWQGQKAPVNGMAAVPPLESVTDPASYPLPDLAVLEVGEAAGLGHPCAALATERPARGAGGGRGGRGTGAAPAGRGGA